MFKQRLERIYGDDKTVELIDCELERLVNKYKGRVPGLSNNPWDQKDTFLITYGDSIVNDGQMPLTTLNQFADKELSDIISFIHILPFFLGA